LGNPGIYRQINDLTGGAAVVRFLLISGYSIAASYKRDQTRFYARRLWRIAPLYLAVLPACLPIAFAYHGRLMPGGQQVTHPHPADLC
jgi:peptidoglycan/LPS O-acetylase OafA/YrhL